jgi:hypothetical protein
VNSSSVRARPASGASARFTTSTLGMAMVPVLRPVPYVEAGILRARY